MFVRSLVLIGALIMSAPTAVAAEYPTPTGFVNDFANVLSVDTQNALEAELSTFAASTTNEVVVVTVANMGGDYIEHYAAELFKTWGIGKEKSDNGVLLVIALEERELRIEVGYGLEGALPDALAARIIDTEVVPHLSAGDFDTGVTAGVRAIMAATQNEYAGTSDTPSDPVPYVELFFFGLIGLQWLAAILARSRGVWLGGLLGVLVGAVLSSIFAWWVFNGVLVTVLLAGLGVALDMAVSGAYMSAKSRGTTPPWWTGGSGGFGGGSSSGGFGGFGGGMSGGGGASGRF